MKWFKHHSDSGTGEGLVKLRNEFGSLGYGVWVLILEAIAAKMDQSDKCSVCYPIKYWAKISGVSPKKFQKIVEFMAKPEIQRLSIKKSGENFEYLTIECAQLLEDRDEYSRKSRKRQDNFKRKEADIDINIKEEEAAGEAAGEAAEEAVRIKNELITSTFENLDQINPLLQEAYYNMAENLLMGEEQIRAVLSVCHDHKRIHEAVMCAFEYNQDLIERGQTVISNPSSFIKHAYKTGQLSKKTRYKKSSLKYVNGESKFDRAFEKAIAKGMA